MLAPCFATPYKRHFCSHACKSASQRKEKKPKPPPVSRRIRLPRTCPVCGKYFEVTPSRIESAVVLHCSRECAYITNGKRNAGMNSHFWRGGGGRIRDYGPNWPQQRRNARRRDDYKCQHCGKSEKELGRQLDVHHIKPFREFGPAHYREANLLTNLRSLCISCHSYLHSTGG